ncbi:xylulokinase [Aureimonas phyllosphaerae]|uniref:Xylulose kinase n=1 Tax=Aureimonas phyllosphaerae TaxID=1166078 RepID=A0A7W6BWN3_9HYPH|nr:xylulokinase [Aureimonas phyllosphaerae]MBB3934152.1 xylulokinase [Aureimonas phyllosphaerae]MBB3958632.1 xylulokinase [Aureimonas phyllosphaerae]SFE99924.1 xylulokinase [Aureimonas phyllosphaerae]
MTECLLGIDIGTSGCKALLAGLDGTVLASRTETYPLSQPRPGWSEQDPADWVDATRRAVGALQAERPGLVVKAIGLSGQMHGLTPLDAAHRVLRPAILWNDQRNGPECAEATERAGGEEALLALTNNRMLVGYTGGKILWMRRHEPELFTRLAHVLNPKDYLRLVLTGERASEVSDASGTGLFDTRARRWSDELLRRLDLSPDLLPPVHESAEITGRLSASGAALLGLPEGVPVVGGGGDAVIQTLGSGVIAPGEIQTTIGTAGIVACALDRPSDNPGGRLQVFCNVDPAKWHCMGVSLNAGGAMSWFRGLAADFAGGDAPSFDALVARAEASPAGARGLLFLPYLFGERCPHPDPAARGAFVGLTARHGAADLTRAVMEGVAHGLRDIFAVMEEAGIAPGIVKASGGGARSRLWRQMQADLFGCDVVTTEGAAEGGAYGAALLAGVGIGVWPDAATAATVCRPVTRETPDPEAGAVLGAANRIYRTLHSALAQASADLGHPRLDP